MPFVKLPPLSPELHALMLEVRAALEGAEVGKPAPMPPGLMQRIEDRMREEALARRRCRDGKPLWREGERQCLTL